MSTRSLEEVKWNGTLAQGAGGRTTALRRIEDPVQPSTRPMRKRGDASGDHGRACVRRHARRCVHAVDLRKGLNASLNNDTIWVEDSIAQYKFYELTLNGWSYTSVPLTPVTLPAPLVREIERRDTSAVYKEGTVKVMLVFRNAQRTRVRLYSDAFYKALKGDPSLLAIQNNTVLTDIARMTAGDRGPVLDRIQSVAQKNSDREWQTLATEILRLSGTEKNDILAHLQAKTPAHLVDMFNRPLFAGFLDVIAAAREDDVEMQENVVELEPKSWMVLFAAPLRPVPRELCARLHRWGIPYAGELCDEVNQRNMDPGRSGSRGGPGRHVPRTSIVSHGTATTASCPRRTHGS